MWLVWTKSPRADARTRVRSRGLLCKCTVLRGQPVYNVPATDLCLKIDPPRPLSVHPLLGARGYYSFDFSYHEDWLPTYQRTSRLFSSQDLDFYVALTLIRATYIYNANRQAEEKFFLKIFLKPEKFLKPFIFFLNNTKID